MTKKSKSNYKHVFAVRVTDPVKAAEIMEFAEAEGRSYGNYFLTLHDEWAAVKAGMDGGEQ